MLYCLSHYHETFSSYGIRQYVIEVIIHVQKRTREGTYDLEEEPPSSLIYFILVMKDICLQEKKAVENVSSFSSIIWILYGKVRPFVRTVSPIISHIIFFPVNREKCGRFPNREALCRQSIFFYTKRY